MYENSGARMRFKKRRKRGGSMNSFSRNSSISSSFISSFSNFSKTKKKNVNETERLINLARQEKKKLKNFILDLNEQHKQGKISYLEYENKFDRVLKRKSPEYWLNYYDNYIKKQKVKLFPPRKEVKINISHIFIILFISFIVLSIFLFGPSLQKTITGFFVAPPGFEEKNYVDEINLITNENEVYDWVPDYEGQMVSFKLNGKIIGEGIVKIWLEDKLIYSNEPNVPVSITGAAVETFGMPEEVNETNITEENVTKDIPEEPVENITEPLPEPVPVPEPQPEPVVQEISLDNVCFETCDLTDFNLNQESYMIIIEIDNAELQIDSFSYTILEEIEEVPADITFVPTEEIVDTTFVPTAEIANITFTPTTKTVCDENNRCTLTLYSVVRYVNENGNWIEIEDSTVDLMEYFNVKYLSKDKNLHLTVKNLTYNSIVLCGNVEQSEIGKQIPLKYASIKNNEKIETNLVFSKAKQDVCKEIVINNTMSYNYTLGSASITIKLEAVDSENLEDINILEENPDTNYGGLLEFHLLAESGNLYRQEGILKYNISSIPAGSTVEEAMFYAYWSKENIDAGEEFHADAHHLYDMDWTEDVITWTIAATYSYNTTYETRNTLTGASPIGPWVNWTVTNMLINATESNHNNVSIWIRSVYSTGSPAGNDDIEFNTKENLNYHPYLNITYEPPTDVTAPEVRLNLPANNTNQSSPVTFNCSAIDTESELNNVTLYGSWLGGWHKNETKELLGTEENSTLFTKNIPDGDYFWNCYACDQEDNCGFNNTNFTLSIDSVSPTITDASINYSTPVNVDTIVKVNATIIDAAGHLDNISLTVIPPSGVGYNTSVENNGDEWYNETIKLDVSGKWQFKWWANDSSGNNATAVYAQDLASNFYINASNGPQFSDYNKNETIVGSGKFLKFNLTVTDGDGISFVNGTVDLIDVDFTFVSGDEWMYQWGPCSASDDTVDFTYVSGNDSMNLWNSTSVSGVVAECDAVAPTVSDEGYNETEIEINEWFCVNATVSDTEGHLDKVVANIWDTTQFINYTMTDTGSTTCDVDSGDGIYGIEVQGTTAGYWNFSRVYANDTGGNLNSYTIVGNITVNVTPVSNTAPRIENISVINDTEPDEASARDIKFSFTVYDAQGSSTLDTATIKINLSVSGSEKNVSRYNDTCVDVGDLDSYTKNFSCAVDLWYWDPDTEWNVTINISDTEGLESTNKTMWFNYTTLTAIQLGPSSLGFGSISPGASNTTATSALTLNNTGNDFDLSIQINTTGLWNQTKYIAAENFTVDIETGASNPECDIGGGSTVLQNGTWTTIVGAILLRGNNTAGLGQEQLYFCLTNVSTTLPSQDYTTEEKGPWWIKILLVAVLPAAGVLSKKKKKKKQRQEQKSKQDLEPTKEKLLKIFEINNEDLRKYEELKEKYNLSAQDVLNLIEIRKLKEKEKRIKEIGLTIPISLLKKDKKSKLGPAETLVKYLKENLGLRLNEIARILKRDQRTIWLTYNNARKKKKEKIIVKKEKLSIPISILKNRKISILESIIIYLKEKGFSNIEIASLLNRDIRNIYTLILRARDKLKEK